MQMKFIAFGFGKCRALIELELADKISAGERGLNWAGEIRYCWSHHNDRIPVSLLKAALL
jgi:hypothetical protein